MMTFSHIIQLEDTFLQLQQLPEKVKLTPSMVRANYLSISPFPGGDLLYRQDDRQLSIWYTRQPLADSYQVAVPEADLVCRAHPAAADAILIYPKPQATAYLVQREGRLVAQVVLTVASNETEEDVLELLTREHSLRAPQITRVASDFQPQVSFADLRSFARYDLDSSELFTRLIDFVKLPLILALLVSIGFQLYGQHALTSNVEQQQARLAELKQNNASLKQGLREVETEVDFWRLFQQQEQRLPEFTLVLSDITSAVSEAGGYLTNLRYGGNNINFWAGIKGAPTALVDLLLKNGHFSNVKVVSTRQEPRNPEVELVQLRLTLKENLTATAKAGGEHVR